MYTAQSELLAKSSGKLHMNSQDLHVDAKKEEEAS
jgi:hypothetical protein